MASLSTFAQFKNLRNSNLIVPDDDMLRQLQQVILTIADDIIDFCESHGINYELGGGSVLGALRHQGFIPWDDDIDINMPRSDYDRFFKEFAAAFPDKYSLHSVECTPGYRSWGGKVRLNGTTLKDKEDIYTNDCGVWIDIFPIENTYDNPILRWWHGVISDFYGLICSCVRTRQDKDYYFSLVQDNADLKKSLKIKACLGALFSFRSYNEWMKRSTRWFLRCRNGQSQFVTVPSGRAHFFGELKRREDLVETRKATFEGRQWNVPKNAEHYLECLYGDWQQLPPEDQREHHAFFAFDLGKWGAAS